MSCLQTAKESHATGVGLYETAEFSQQLEESRQVRFALCTDSWGPFILASFTSRIQALEAKLLVKAIVYCAYKSLYAKRLLDWLRGEQHHRENASETAPPANIPLSNSSDIVFQLSIYGMILEHTTQLSRHCSLNVLTIRL